MSFQLTNYVGPPMDAATSETKYSLIILSFFWWMRDEELCPFPVYCEVRRELKTNFEMSCETYYLFRTGVSLI
jgi:hypothetical protein